MGFLVESLYPDAPNQARSWLYPPSPIEYPRRVESFHQIEIASHCNLRCVYCPSRKLEEVRHQEKMYMDRKTFERTLEWCVYYEDICGTQNELSLTGLGETLMHPDFLEYATLAREALPHNFINLSTNGLLLTEKICEHLAKLNIRLYISMHRPEKAGPAIQKAKKYGILNDTNDSFATSAFDWGGQVDWYVSAPEKTPCEWLRSGWANVLVDGRITACCLDAAAAGVFAHVDDEIGEAYTKPFDLCSTCHMSVP